MVVSCQADLRSKVSGKDPWRIDVRGSGARRVQWSRSPPHTVGRAEGPGDAGWMAQEVVGSKLYLEEARCCVAREGEDGRELCGGGEGEVISRYVPDLPL